MRSLFFDNCFPQKNLFLWFGFWQSDLSTSSDVKIYGVMRCISKCWNWVLLHLSRIHFAQKGKLVVKGMAHLFLLITFKSSVIVRIQLIIFCIVLIFYITFFQNVALYLFYLTDLKRVYLWNIWFVFWLLDLSISADVKIQGVLRRIVKCCRWVQLQ